MAQIRPTQYQRRGGGGFEVRQTYRLLNLFVGFFGLDSVRVTEGRILETAVRSGINFVNNCGAA